MRVVAEKSYESEISKKKNPRYISSVSSLRVSFVSVLCQLFLVWTSRHDTCPSGTVVSRTRPDPTLHSLFALAAPNRRSSSVWAPRPRKPRLSSLLFLQCLYTQRGRLSLRPVLGYARE